MRMDKEADLNRLGGLAFKRMEACRPLIELFYGLPASAHEHPDYGLLQSSYAWLFVPYSLWPIDIGGLITNLLERICSNKRCAKDVAVLVRFLGSVPSEEANAAVSAHEHDVRVGNYEHLIAAHHKYDFKEQELSHKPEFKDDWSMLKAHFEIPKYRDSKGIIRRSMVQERNFRPKGWDFSWGSKEARFRSVFDAFCHKWMLYGMEGEKPLLQKLSVNITPLGTMIFIPRYWSFDQKRDLEWGAINGLHRSRDVHRQGVKLTPGQLAKLGEVERAKVYWKEASQNGLKGENRDNWVMAKLKWGSRTDARQLRRLLKQKMTAKRSPHNS